MILREYSLFLRCDNSIVVMFLERVSFSFRDNAKIATDEMTRLGFAAQ